MDNLKAPRHIAIFLPSLNGGGAERVMVNLANGFLERGHKVDLVLAYAEGPYLTEVATGVRIIDLHKGRVLKSLLPLVKYLNRERPDTMLSALNHANIIAILACKIAEVQTRVFVSERNSLADLSGGGFSSVILWLMRRLYPFADGVITVSRGLTQELVVKLGLAPELITAIPNAVDIGALAILARDRPQHPWFNEDAPTVILAVGRLTPQKDYFTLLDAFARVRDTRDIRLIILGEGPLRADLERRIVFLGLSDSVQLVGFQKNPFGWMAACKTYVLSSRFEGFPNSLIQAMACGARIVSADCPTGPDEILQGGVWGRLVPVGDVASMADAIAKSLDDPAPPDTIARAAEYSPDLAIARYEAALFGMRNG